jgi:hypothetical protein
MKLFPSACSRNNWPGFFEITISLEAITIMSSNGKTETLYLSLFVSENNDSKKAEALLKESGFDYDVSHVPRESPDRMEFDTLPTLIGGYGYWSGFNNITGQTGTDKKTFAEKIVKHYTEKRVIPTDSEEARDHIRVFELEKRLVNKSVLNFVTGYNQREKRRIWNETFEEILTDIENRPSRHVVLCMHATYYRDGHFFSPASWDLLLKFRPDCVITLIDDIYER